MQRDRIVSGRPSGLDDTRTTRLSRGGSSSVFKKAFAALMFIVSASSTIAIFFLPSSALKESFSSSFLTASILISFFSGKVNVTSGCVAASIFLHETQVSQQSESAGSKQLIAFA